MAVKGSGISSAGSRLNRRREPQDGSKLKKRKIRTKPASYASEIQNFSLDSRIYVESFKKKKKRNRKFEIEGT